MRKIIVIADEEHERYSHLMTYLDALDCVRRVQIERYEPSSAPKPTAPVAAAPTPPKAAEPVEHKVLNRAHAHDAASHGRRSRKGGNFKTPNWPYHKPQLILGIMEHLSSTAKPQTNNDIRWALTSLLERFKLLEPKKMHNALGSLLRELEREGLIVYELVYDVPGARNKDHSVRLYTITEKGTTRLKAMNAANNILNNGMPPEFYPELPLNT